MKNRILLVLLLPLFFSCTRSPDLLWKVDSGAAIMSSPSISGNVLYIGSCDFNLYALDKASGKILWKTNLGDRIFSKPLISGKNIYIGGGKNFFCLDAATGKVQWKYETGDLIQYDPCEDNDSIYVGSNDFHFYKI